MRSVLFEPIFIKFYWVFQRRIRPHPLQTKFIDSMHPIFIFALSNIYRPQPTTIPFQRKHADFFFLHGFLLFRLFWWRKNEIHRSAHTCRNLTRPTPAARWNSFPYPLTTIFRLTHNQATQRKVKKKNRNSRSPETNDIGIPVGSLLLLFGSSIIPHHDWVPFDCSIVFSPEFCTQLKYTVVLVSWVYSINKDIEYIVTRFPFHVTQI